MKVKVHISERGTNKTLVTFYSYGVMGMDFIAPVIEAGYIVVMVMVDDVVKDCSKCRLYGQCDHLGAYQKDGKWCYE